MPQLSEERKEQLVRVLRENKRRIWNELREDLFKETNSLQTQYDIPQDLGEQGMIDTLEDMGLTVANIRQDQLIQMEQAERKLQEGSYGICENCGQEIDERRLELMPFANYCMPCQEQREEPEKPSRVTL
ncbi:MAG TPA: TraR/DksA C4-type zinc finger protein [Desulfuromonadaceae bacterium]|jgi:DnaK suppressor protein